MVKLETSHGEIVIELNEGKAPVTCANFLTYVKEGFYDETIFHRIIPNFMVQGGGFDAEMEQKKTYDPIVNEANNGLANQRGSLAMARTNDPHSASSQFFINLVDNAFLNYNPPQSDGYAVFGQVVEGMDVVDVMASVPTGRQGHHDDVPMEPVMILKAMVV